MISDLRKPFSGLVLTAGHRSTQEANFSKSTRFAESQRIFPKERDNPLEQVLPTMNGVAVKVLPVVIVPPVDVHPSHSEVTRVAPRHSGRC
jgi:hypothetical protein